RGGSCRAGRARPGGVEPGWRPGPAGSSRRGSSSSGSDLVVAGEDPVDELVGDRADGHDPRREDQLLADVGVVALVVGPVALQLDEDGVVHVGAGVGEVVHQGALVAADGDAVAAVFDLAAAVAAASLPDGGGRGAVAAAAGAGVAAPVAGIK